DLASVLRDADVQHVHSSDFIRTRNTAAPIAARLSLNVELYDAQDLPSLVEKVRQAGGRHLIVGHSTSTPRVVELLGGQAGTGIDEAGEFDRLYIVTIDTNRQASTVLLRYGTPFNKAESE
ncbi:MAG: histidine phosphatase family protein, partial [Planctomycetota bacterium]